MKGIIISILLSLVLVTSAMAVDVTYSLPNEQYDRIKAAFLARYPNTECAEYDDLGSTCIKLKYTDNQWIKERIRRFIRDTFKAGERRLGRADAYNTMPKDHDSIIQLKTSTASQ